MTSSITRVIERAITAHGHQDLATTGGILVIVLLLVLLFEQGVMRAAGGVRWDAGARALNAAIVPLLFAFVAIIVMRLLHFLQLV